MAPASDLSICLAMESVSNRDLPGSRNRQSPLRSSRLRLLLNTPVQCPLVLSARGQESLVATLIIEPSSTDEETEGQWRSREKEVSARTRSTCSRPGGRSAQPEITSFCWLHGAHGGMIRLCDRSDTPVPACQSKTKGSARQFDCIVHHGLRWFFPRVTRSSPVFCCTQTNAQLSVLKSPSHAVKRV